MANEAKNIVTQKQLRRYLRLGKLAQDAAEALQHVEDQQAIIGLEITKLLEAGAAVEEGECKALLNTETGARRPQWKEIYLGHMSLVHGDNRDIIEAEAVSKCEPKTKQVLVVTKT